MTDRVAIERLRQLLQYEPDTGLIRWKVPRNRMLAGKIAGWPDNNGYIRILVDGKKHWAHHVAWAMYHGEWSPHLVDHKNHNKSDNRIENLRPATYSQNSQNKRVSKRNKFGLKGVTIRPSGRYTATICINRRNKVLGTFATKEEAAEAYNKAAAKIFGEFAHVNVL